MQEDTSFGTLGTVSSISALAEFEALGEDAIRHRRGEPAPLLVTACELLIWGVAFVVGCYFMQADRNSPLPETWSFGRQATCDPAAKTMPGGTPAGSQSPDCAPAARRTVQ